MCDAPGVKPDTKQVKCLDLKKVASAPAVLAAFERIERLAKVVFQVKTATIVLYNTDRLAEHRSSTCDAIGFTAEAPLLGRDGIAVGSLSLSDTVPRPAMSVQEHASLADLATTAMDALALQLEVIARGQDIERLALSETLLRIVADAPNFAAAIDSAMAALRDATQSMLCLFFRLGPDDIHLHLVAGQSSHPALTTAYVNHLRQTSIRLDNSLVGLVAATGEQQVVTGIDESSLDRYPALKLSVTEHMASQIVTPIWLGSERYAFSVGFGADVDDIVGISQMLTGLTNTLRPLLRRLRDAEEIELFRRVVEASSDAVIISEAVAPVPAGPRISYVNAAFCQQTGYSRREVIGQIYPFLQNMKDPTAFADTMATSFMAGKPIRLDVLNYRRDGSEFWAELNMAPVGNVMGSYTHWVSIERDITERKRAQASIALSEQRFRVVARATSDVVWDWNLATGTIWWSEGIHTQFGHDPDESQLDFSWWANHVAADDRQRAMTSRQAAVANHIAEWREEYRFEKADGTLALVNDRGFLVHDSGGNAVRMIGSMVDVTVQRLMEEQLRQSQRLDAVGTLTGGVAHDFNNLLTIITGHAEAIQDLAQDDPGLLEFVLPIFAATERGAELTNHLLTFARLHPTNPKLVNANALVAKMEDLVRRVIGVDVELHLLITDAATTMTADGPQFEHAILNLCINAREAMPAGGKLTLETAIVHRGIRTRMSIDGTHQSLNQRHGRRHGEGGRFTCVRPVLHHEDFRQRQWAWIEHGVRLRQPVQRSSDHRI
jgi:PAS domain S-box-containing protein